LSENPLYRIYSREALACSNMIVCWREDNGCLGSEVSRYLAQSLKMSPLGEIDPEDFFPMNGVFVENDIAKFPESKLYISRDHGLVLLDSAVPRAEWFRFINAVLEIAGNTCRIQRLFTVGSMISSTPHSSPRLLMTSLNNAESKRYLQNYDIILDMDYETPSGQRPTMSTYLVWEALRYGIDGISLWATVPFYMAAVKDWAACSRIIKLLNSRLDLRMETGDLDYEVDKQNRAIADVIDNDPGIGEIMNKFVSDAGITEAESNRLVSAIESRLGRGECY
jgi:predicted ATP-grasp superfamily ATP-dependent carboligase